MANTLKFGNGNFATKAGSTLCYDDQNGNFKPIPMDFSRNSIGTRVNKQGLIEVMQADIPRIDYTDTDKGVALLENSSTNLVLYSEDFSNAYWDKQTTTILSNNAISPDGTLNATKLREIDNNGFHRIRRNASISISPYASIGVFAKAGERDWIKIRESAQTGAYAFFNIKEGYIGEIGITATPKIEYYGNGWYRCSFSKNLTAASVDIRVCLSDGVDTYQGDGTSGVYIWGAQLESGSITSSYIPTSGSTVTRAADVANGSGNSEVFNDSEGVLMLETKFLQSGRIGISNSDNSDQVVIGLASGLGIFYRIRENNSNPITQFVGVSEFQNNKIAVKYKSTETSFFVNGFELNTNSTSYILNGLNELAFTSESSPLYGKTKEIGYYDEILTDSELEYLTSYRSLSELVKELNLNTL